MGWVRWMYDWVLGWAASPFGPLALFVLAFVESSFFPIPPDPLLIALCLGLATRSLQFALLCTVGSVMGGLFGYWIGHSAFELVGLPILEFYGKVDVFETYRDWFREQGNLAVLLAAITPIPYKVITITAGAAGMDVAAFTAASVVGRGFRFFLIAGLIHWKGEAIAHFIEAHFDKLTIAFGVLLVGGFLVLRLLLH
ncbi:MAG: DedA family protein [Alphaproteobacteria bacterium]|nr:DedA family protein [Alphaproteobacteria bacterium]